MLVSLVSGEIEIDRLGPHDLAMLFGAIGEVGKGEVLTGKKHCPALPMKLVEKAK